jgi:hypothetical protein
MRDLNLFMVATGFLQILGAGYGYLDARDWRINCVNILVGCANLLLSGVR